jgi:hypothetical protein
LAGPLLQGVSQLVSQQQLAGEGAWGELATTENNMGPDCIRICPHRRRRLGRLGICVDQNAAEVVSEPLLHVRSDLGVQRAARRP